MYNFIVSIVGLTSMVMLVLLVVSIVKFKQKNKTDGKKFLKFTGISFAIIMVLSLISGLFEEPTDSAQSKKELETTTSVDNDEEDEANKEADLKAKEDERVAKEAEEKALAEEIAKQVAAKPEEEIKKTEEQKANVTETTPVSTTQVTTPETSDTILVNDMKKIITDKLGKKNNLKKNTVNDIQYVADDKGAIIALNANENLTKNMTKKGMWMDSKKILQPLSKLDGLDIIIIHWYYPLVDAYGNEKDGIVMSFEINKETLNKINWDNFLTDNIPNVVSNYSEHQAFNN